MRYGGVLSQEELDVLIRKGKFYKRKAPVQAVVLTQRIFIEEPDGDIVTGNVGDYLIQNGEGDKRPWILSPDYFEQHFEELSAVESKNFEKKIERQKPTNGKKQNGEKISLEIIE
jgi:hypothetical protein